MPNRFPRTPAEFAATNRAVVLRRECGATTWLKPQNLVQRLGPDFDLYGDFPQLRETYRCECGKLPSVTFSNPDRDHFAPVSFEDATTSALELAAFALARDAAELGVAQDELRRRRREQSSGRVRKFGGRRRR